MARDGDIETVRAFLKLKYANINQQMSDVDDGSLKMSHILYKIERGEETGLLQNKKDGLDIG